MEDLAKHPHLIQRGSTWHYRRKIPGDLVDLYRPKREITFSLGTKVYAEAVALSRKESVKLDEEFARHRAYANAKPVSVISENEV